MIKVIYKPYGAGQRFINKIQYIYIENDYTNHCTSITGKISTLRLLFINDTDIFRKICRTLPLLENVA